MEKLKAIDLVDGPPFLVSYTWTEEMFEGMCGCGVAPHGDRAINQTIYIKKIAENYSYLQWMPACNQVHKLTTQRPPRESCGLCCPIVLTG